MTTVFKIVIPSGGSQSNTIDLTGFKLFKISMPSAWTEAALTFLSAPDEVSDFQKVTNDSGTETSIASTVALASTDIVIDAAIIPLASMTLCKFRSGTAATPVNQGTERIIKLVAKS